MEYFFLIFITLVIIQWYLKMKQTKTFYTYYHLFLQGGNVLVERHKGIFWGAIIMFQLDEEANIKNCMLMKGASPFASPEYCDGLINNNLLCLDPHSLLDYDKCVRRAIDKAIASYYDKKVL